MPICLLLSTIDFLLLKFDYSILSYIRYAKDKNDFLIVVCNFTPVEHRDFVLGVPEDAEYHKVFASKGEDGMSLICNANEGECNNLPFNIKLNLPGYGALVYKPVFRDINTD